MLQIPNASNKIYFIFKKVALEHCGQDSGLISVDGKRCGERCSKPSAAANKVKFKYWKKKSGIKIMNPMGCLEN